MTEENGEFLYSPEAAIEGGEGWKQIEAQLTNGMQLVLTAPENEINAIANHMLVYLCHQYGIIVDPFILSLFIFEFLAYPAHH